ncbi:hypothetical protein OC835_006402 [Tilletia horrida]|nr:hypothetical protein OC835_006402 [Tilletia horrida]
MANNLARLEFLEVDFLRFMARGRVALDASDQENTNDIEKAKFQLAAVSDEVRARAQRTKANYEADMAKFAAQLKHCVSEMGREIRRTQEELIRIHAQMMAINTWSAAVSESVHVPPGLEQVGQAEDHQSVQGMNAGFAAASTAEQVPLVSAGVTSSTRDSSGSNMNLPPVYAA